MAGQKVLCVWLPIKLDPDCRSYWKSKRGRGDAFFWWEFHMGTGYAKMTFKQSQNFATAQRLEKHTIYEDCTNLSISEGEKFFWSQETGKPNR